MPARYGSALTATISGVLDQLRRARPVGRLDEADRLDGELCLVTGGPSNIPMSGLILRR